MIGNNGKANILRNLFHMCLMYFESGKSITTLFSRVFLRLLFLEAENKNGKHREIFFETDASDVWRKHQYA